MKNFILVTIAGLLFCTGCKVQKENDTNKALLMSYSRTPCFGTCEVFDVKIYDNGSVLIEKKQFMSEKGDFALTLSNKELRQIESSLNEMSFCKLDSLYGVGVSDLPSSIITYQCGKEYKTVVAIMNYPNEIKALIENMADLVKREDLTPLTFD
ncbi:MAG: hypothetical protein JXQ87_09850 [Bacteroidia bacterium]